VSLSLLLIIVLIVLVIGGAPNWGYHNYGYGPSGLFGVLCIILLVLFLLGRI
jgi:hypothetical protein